MERSIKILLGILSFFAVVMFVIYAALSVVNKQIPKELEFPKSGMSQSIFDSQNTKYAENPAFTGEYHFQKSPYMVDIAETDMAKVSETGTVYKISDTMYFYITEFSKDTSIESVIRSELPKAVMIDSNAEMTAIDNYVYEEGYVNGFKGDYYIDCMTVTNGGRAASVYITGYALTITDESLDHGYKMFLSVVSAVSDTDVYAEGKQILDSVVQTYQVDYDTQKKLVDAENAAIAEAERRREEAVTNGENYVPVSSSANASSDENLIVSSENSTTDLASNASVASGGGLNRGDYVPPNKNIKPEAYINGAGSVNNNAGNGQGAAANAAIPVQKTKSMELTEAYEGVTLYYYYQNTDSEINVVLENPSGDKTYTPSSTAQGTVIFKVDYMEAGKWHVYVSGDAGTDSMKLYSGKTSSGQQGSAEESHMTD